jgi:hypothetical protein
MPPEESFGMVTLGRFVAKPAYLIDFQVSKYTMVAVLAVERRE